MAEEIDTLFQEAVDALHNGDRPHAKELLTRLLKTDQNNANYWVWMSAAVETPKERVYCLQTALRIDPQNAAAKRGLILLGAAAADENVQPFSVNRPRAWEDELKLAHEKPKEKRPFLASPLVRIAGLGLVGVVILGLVIFGFILPKTRQFVIRPISTSSGPTSTFTVTPTFVNATAPAISTFTGPTPLWARLPATYTPTPFYLPTVVDPQLTEILRAVKTAYSQGSWDEMRGYLQQGISVRPDLPDLWYLIGESYRFEEKYSEALDGYDHAIQLDANFGPAYMGRAQVALAQDPKADVLSDLDQAIAVSPNLTEAYILRASYEIDQNNTDSALQDLRTAGQLAPDSALVFYQYARLYLALNEPENAVTAAKHANNLDITMLPVYLVLGEAYAADNQPTEAAQALQTYVSYSPDDPAAYLELGKLQYMSGDYEAALTNLEKSISMKNDPEARLCHGLTLVELGRGDDALFELRNALDFYPQSFIGHLGLVRAWYLTGKFGNAAIETDTAFALAETDEEKGQVYYWRAKAYEQQPARLQDAIRDWESLLALPETAVPAAWRREAQQQIAALITPTISPTPTKTSTPTKTPTPTRTPSPSPTPSPMPK